MNAMLQRLSGRADPASNKAQLGGEAHPQTDSRPPPTDLVIVIVSWNVWDHLRACLTSIEQQSKPIDEGRAERKKRSNDSHSSTPVRRFGPRNEATLQVVVLDNASEDATTSLLPSRFPWVQTISATKIWFHPRNNRALEAIGLTPCRRRRRGKSPIRTGAPASPPSSDSDSNLSATRLPAPTPRPVSSTSSTPTPNSFPVACGRSTMA